MTVAQSTVKPRFKLLFSLERNSIFSPFGSYSDVRMHLILHGIHSFLLGF